MEVFRLGFLPTTKRERREGSNSQKKSLKQSSRNNQRSWKSIDCNAIEEKYEGTKSVISPTNNSQRLMKEIKIYDFKVSATNETIAERRVT